MTSLDPNQMAAVEKAIHAIDDLTDAIIVSHPALEKIDYSKTVDDNTTSTKSDERFVKALFNGRNARNKLKKLLD